MKPQSITLWLVGVALSVALIWNAVDQKHSRESRRAAYLRDNFCAVETYVGKDAEPAYRCARGGYLIKRSELP